jgi:hypothetical protein
VASSSDNVYNESSFDIPYESWAPSRIGVALAKLPEDIETPAVELSELW